MTVNLTVDRTGVAEITLRRAAINPAWVDALAEAVAGCANDDQIRAVLVRADGPTFTVGGDLHHFTAEIDDLPGALEQMIAPYHQTLLALADLPVPVVCAAQGAIAGGGLGLLWASDLVLLADDAKLATGFSRLGLSGDGGSTWYLPRMLGTRRALALMLQGTVLGATAVLELGLADQVVPADQLGAAGTSAALRLAAGPTVALAEIRRLVRAAFERTLADGLDAELAANLRCAVTADACEGIASFTERREPKFLGR